MSHPRILTDVIGRHLKPPGFKRKADTWRLWNDDTVRILNLQKSDYGRQYYINIAVWLNALGDADAPKAHQCQIRCRWEALVPGVDKEHLEKILDLEDTSISDDKRGAEISRLLEELVLPFFGRVASLSDIRAIYQTSLWPRGCAVYRVAQDLLTS